MINCLKAIPVESRLKDLTTFVKHSESEFWLLGNEKGPSDRWSFDVRLFFQKEGRLLFEVSAHPKSIEAELMSFLRWMANETPTTVIDVDGQFSGWLTGS